MSIQSEINRIAGAKSDIADAIEDKDVTVPSGTKLDGMANLIRQIPGGSEKLNSTQAADAYDPTATYAVGDKVSYAGNVYSCISAISTPEAWDSTHWDQVDPIQDQVDDVRNTLNRIQPLSFTVTLSSVSWSSNAQTVSNVNLIVSGYSYVVSPVSTNFSDYANAQIYADDVTTDGSMTFHCANVPTTNLTVNVLRMGVA